MTPTILCVDDDEAMTRMLHDTLTPRGFNVVTAGSVAMAVDVASRIKLDLIILDVQLPDAEGFALFARLVEETPNGKVPVVMATGLSSVVARNIASRRGAVAYLQKPYQIQQLLSVINWAAPAPEQPVT